MAKRFLEYKGYSGTVEYSLEDQVLFGKVVGIKGLLSYEGTTLKELAEDFRGVVDDYLRDCQAAGVEPQKSYKGSFNVRIDPELHRELANYAADHDESLNASVAEAVKKLVGELK